MPRFILRKAALPAPSPSHVLVSRHNQSVGILRGNISANRTPHRGQAMDKMPVDLSAEQRSEIADAPTRLSDISRNLFTDPTEARYWAGAIGEMVDDAAGEIGFRQQLFQMVRQADLSPSVGKTLLRRSVQWYKKRNARP